MIKQRLGKIKCSEIWGAILVLLLAFPSLAQMQISRSGPPTLTRIEVKDFVSSSRIIIEGSHSFEYTVSKEFNPLRIIVDLPNAELGKLAGPMDVRNGTVNLIRKRQLDGGARIEIGLDQSVDYQVIPEEKILYIELGKASAPPIKVGKMEAEPAERETSFKGPGKIIETPIHPAALSKPTGLGFLNEFVFSERPGTLEVYIKIQEPKEDYQSFQLPKPPRLVVDLPKVTNATSKRMIDVGNPLLKDIRIGQYPEKVRLVFTFPEAQTPPYQMAIEEQGLRVVFGQEKPQEMKVSFPIALMQADLVTEKKKEKTPSVENKIELIPMTVAGQENTAKRETPAEIKDVEGDRIQLSRYRGAKISLDFKEADIHNIFRLIADVSNLNIITTDDVKGKVTIRLLDVPWDQALDIILTSKNLIKIEEGNVLRISTLDSLRKDREESQKEEETLLKTRDMKLKLEDPGRKIIKVNYAKAEDIQKLLLEKKDEGKGFLSPQGSVKADKRTNTLIIQDVRTNLEEIEQLVKKLDSATPQVLIEARVVQAQTTFARSLGIQWGGSYNQTSSSGWAWGLTGNDTSANVGWGYSPTSSTFNTTTGTQQTQISGPTNISMPSNFVVNFPASTSYTSTSGIGISLGKLTGSLVNLDLRLSMGETDGQTKVIARPKLITLDNTKAHIKQGELVPYETTSQAGTQVQFIDAVLLLEVTPHVTPDGSIKMSIKITRDARGSFRTQINQVPSVDKREASTEVLVKDGETIVIGGIYESENSETTQGLPWLMKIPILGWLFKNEEIYNVRRELLLFITPTILHGKSDA